MLRLSAGTRRVCRRQDLSGLTVLIPEYLLCDVDKGASGDALAANLQRDGAVGGQPDVPPTGN